MMKAQSHHSYTRKRQRKHETRRNRVEKMFRVVNTEPDRFESLFVQAREWPSSTVLFRDFNNFATYGNRVIHKVLLANYEK